MIHQVLKILENQLAKFKIIFTDLNHMHDSYVAFDTHLDVYSIQIDEWP